MKVIPLAVAGAFHTPLMQPAVERLRAALADVPMKQPRIPVVSNVDARPHDDPDEIRELLIQQVCSQVRWEDSMRYLLDEQKYHAVLRNRPRPRAVRPAETHRPQSAVRKHRGVIQIRFTTETQRARRRMKGRIADESKLIL